MCKLVFFSFMNLGEREKVSVLSYFDGISTDIGISKSTEYQIPSEEHVACYEISFLGSLNEVDRKVICCAMLEMMNDYLEQENDLFIDFTTFKMVNSSCRLASYDVRMISAQINVMLFQVAMSNESRETILNFSAQTNENFKVMNLQIQTLLKKCSPVLAGDVVINPKHLN